jgi:hypothetical protein
MQTKEQAMAHCREVGERIERCVAEGGDLFAQFEGVQMLNFKLEKTDAGPKVVGGELGGDDSRITVSESGATKPWNDEIVGYAFTPETRAALVEFFVTCWHS